jgi:hypothetical protein
MLIEAASHLLRFDNSINSVSIDNLLSRLVAVEQSHATRQPQSAHKVNEMIIEKKRVLDIVFAALLCDAFGSFRPFRIINMQHMYTAVYEPLYLSSHHNYRWISFMNIVKLYVLY